MLQGIEIIAFVEKLFSGCSETVVQWNCSKFLKRIESTKFILVIIINLLFITQ